MSWNSKPLFGDKDFGVTGRREHRASGAYYRCPKCGRECESKFAAADHCKFKTTVSLANSRPCPTCNGYPKDYKKLYGYCCPVCNGAGRI